MTIGDVLALALLIAASAITAWAALLGMGILFSERTRRAADALTRNPGAMIGLGAVVGIPAIGFGIVLFSAAAGPLKIVGWLIIVATLMASALGSAGLASVMGERIGRLSPNHSGFTVLARGAALLVAASYVPVLGWFLLFPLQLFAGIGAGLTAIRRGAAPEAQSQGYQL